MLCLDVALQRIGWALDGIPSPVVRERHVYAEPAYHGALCPAYGCLGTRRVVELNKAKAPVKK